jgi:hypothetical protein
MHYVLSRPPVDRHGYDCQQKDTITLTDCVPRFEAYWSQFFAKFDWFVTTWPTTLPPCACAWGNNKIWQLMITQCHAWIDISILKVCGNKDTRTLVANVHWLLSMKKLLLSSKNHQIILQIKLLNPQFLLIIYDMHLHKNTVVGVNIVPPDNIHYMGPWTPICMYVRLGLGYAPLQN